MGGEEVVAPTRSCLPIPMHAEIETTMVVAEAEDAYPYLEWLEEPARAIPIDTPGERITPVPDERAVVIVDEKPIVQHGPPILDRIRANASYGRVISFTRTGTQHPSVTDAKSDAWIRRPIHRETFTTFVEQYRRIVRYEHLLELHFELIREHPTGDDRDAAIEKEMARLRKTISSIEATFGRSEYAAAFRSLSNQAEFTPIPGTAEDRGRA